MPEVSYREAVRDALAEAMRALPIGTGSSFSGTSSFTG